MRRENGTPRHKSTDLRQSPDLSLSSQKCDVHVPDDVDVHSGPAHTRPPEPT